MPVASDGVLSLRAGGTATTTMPVDADAFKLEVASRVSEEGRGTVDAHDLVDDDEMLCGHFKDQVGMGVSGLLDDEECPFGSCGDDDDDDKEPSSLLPFWGSAAEMTAEPLPRVGSSEPSSSCSSTQSCAAHWSKGTPRALFGNCLGTMWSSPICEGTEQQLFVGGISRQTYEVQLRDYFSQFGEVSEVIVMRHKKTGISRCFGFISYRSNEAVEHALSVEHQIDGRRVEVKRAVPRHLLPGPGLRSRDDQPPPSLFGGTGDARTMLLGGPASLADVANYYGLGSKAAALAYATRRARDRVLLPAWNHKLRRKHREDMKELQFQVTYKYETWGYASPDAFFAAEFPGRSQLDVFTTKPPEAKALEPPQERRLQQLAGEIVDFNQDVLLGRRALGEECYLRPLDDLWRKAMTLVCDDVNDLVRARHLGGEADGFRLTLIHGDSVGTGARRSRKGKSIILKFVAVTSQFSPEPPVVVTPHATQRYGASMFQQQFLMSPPLSPPAAPLTLQPFSTAHHFALPQPPPPPPQASVSPGLAVLSLR